MPGEIGGSILVSFVRTMATQISHALLDGAILAGSACEEPEETNPSYVLVVDDELVVCQLLDRCLTSAGYQARHALSAGAALDAMAESPASLVLCDVKMPGHDGLWLAERLKSEWPSTPVVMVTGMDDLRTVQQSHEIGAVDYLTKPVNRDQLCQAVQRAIGRPAVLLSAAGGAADAPQATEPAIEAEYTLETPVRCPACGERTSTLKAVRLVRARVNFTSTLPRRGRVVACPNCLAIVPAELTNF